MQSKSEQAEPSEESAKRPFKYILIKKNVLRISIQTYEIKFLT